MKIIALTITAFITVLISYVLACETVDKQKNSPTSNAITDKGGNKIKIQLNNNTNKEDK